VHIFVAPVFYCNKNYSFYKFPQDLIIAQWVSPRANSPGCLGAIPESAPEPAPQLAPEAAPQVVPEAVPQPIPEPAPEPT